MWHWVPIEQMGKLRHIESLFKSCPRTPSRSVSELEFEPRQACCTLDVPSFAQYLRLTQCLFLLGLVAKGPAQVQVKALRQVTPELDYSTLPASAEPSSPGRPTLCTLHPRSRPQRTMTGQPSMWPRLTDHDPDQPEGSNHPDES